MCPWVAIEQVGCSPVPVLGVFELPRDFQQGCAVSWFTKSEDKAFGGRGHKKAEEENGGPTSEVQTLFV
jgi:hypothetical protein